MLPATTNRTKQGEGTESEEGGKVEVKRSCSRERFELTSGGKRK